MGDLTTELERQLGKLVREKYKTDFFILHRYPLAVSSPPRATPFPHPLCLCLRLLLRHATLCGMLSAMLP